MKHFWMLVLGCCIATHAQADEPVPLSLRKTIAMPEVKGRFDHAAVDVATHRLFFAALGNDTLEVVDVAAGKRVHTITGLQKPTGVLFLHDENLLIVANGDDGTCRFYDAATYKERGRITGLDDADNLRFDAKTKRVYLGYGEGALGVIDPIAMKLVGSIPLPKHPEAFQLEQNGPRIFGNIPEAKQIAVVDRGQGRVVATWPVEGFRDNFPMALAESQHRVFIGCRNPARLLAYDTQTGRRVADAPLSGDIDDLFLDASSGLMIASCGEGFVDVYRTDAAGPIERTHRIGTSPGARTAFFSPELGFCLAVPRRGSQDAEIGVFSIGERK